MKPKRNHINIILLGVLISLFGCEQEPEKPNFIFILVDDLGWTDLSCYGSELYETPHLDALAADGVTFTSAYAANPVCSPTRAAIMTGKHPSRLNITDWIPGKRPKNRKLLGPDIANALPLREITLAEALKQHGYKTFFAGKWHLGAEGYLPEDQGFDINKGGHHKGSPPGGYYSPYNNPKLEDGEDGEYLPDRLTDESIKFIQENKGNPFLLYLSFYTVHTPIQASKRHIEKFKTKAKALDIGEAEMTDEHEGSTVLKQYNPAYTSMVYAMDENIGRLLRQLEAQGVADNTVIVFTSDNGGLSTLAKGRVSPTSTRPLRAGKGWCYEGGIRVPLIIKTPDYMKLPKGERREPVVSMDYYPTLLELAGLPSMPEQHTDGKSLVPVLRGERMDREALYWHYPHYHGSGWTPGAAIRKGDWKLIEFYDYEKTELYHLKDDIGEQNNLADRYPDKVEELKAELAGMQRETSAKFPAANPGFAADEAIQCEISNSKPQVRSQ